MMILFAEVKLEKLQDFRLRQLLYLCGHLQHSYTRKSSEITSDIIDSEIKMKGESEFKVHLFCLNLFNYVNQF